MKFLPISIETVHEDQLNCLIIEGEMKIDFGPWKKGEHKILTFNFEEGNCSEFDDNGSLVESCELELKVKI